VDPFLRPCFRKERDSDRAPATLGPPNVCRCRTLQVWRHAYTKQGAARGRGSHLSQAGVALARSIGASIGPFAFVAASDAPRTLETSIATGFAVDEVLDLAGDLWERAQSELAHRSARDDPKLYRRYLDLMRAGGVIAALGHRQAELWTRIIGNVPDGAQAVLISHGGLIEPGLVAVLPGWPHERWGRGFRHCEGVQLHHDGTRFVDADVLPSR
jgi:broad specificity phosphatase PhoE